MSRHVSIVIVGYRNTAMIANCVISLTQSTYKDFDVIICENGGKEAADALRAALPNALPSGQKLAIIEGTDNPGYAGGVNLCIAARPDADAWWVVNPDCEPVPEALAALVARLDHGDVEAVGGVLLASDGTLQSLGGVWRGWLARCVSIGKGDPQSSVPPAAEVEGSLDYILGASMLVSRDFLRLNGPMREDYFLYGEEVEWFLRARRKGIGLGFAPRAIIHHHQGGTTGSAAQLRHRPRLPIYLDERNKLHIMRDTAPFRWPIAVMASPVLSFLRYGARGAWRQWHYALSGWLAALWGERGKPDWLSAG